MASKKLKVAWLHTHFLYWMGGTKFVYEVIKRLTDRLDITVFVERSSPVVLAKYDAIGVKVIQIADRSSNDPLYWLLFPLYLQKDKGLLVPQLKKYDCLVSSMFPMNWLAMQVDKPRIQYCYEPFAFFHDPVFINNLLPNKRYFTRLLALLYKRLDIQATQAQDEILTLSDVTRTQIQNIYHRSSQITFEGVDAEFFHPTRRPEIDKKYQGYKVIIHSTDFSPIKGTPLLIQALPQVVKKFPRTKLLITSTINDAKGISQLRSQAKRLRIDKNIEYLGFVDFELLPVLYSRADLLVHSGVGTSGATTMSLPVKEALACETPVIRSPDTQDEVQDGVTGFLVDPHNTRLLAQKIIWLFSHPRQAQKMGRLGRSHIVKNFTWEAVADKIVATVKKTI